MAVASRSIWARLWLRVHGPERVSTASEREAAVQRVASLEREAARYLAVLAQTEALAADVQRRDGGRHGSHQSSHDHDVD